MAVIPQAVATAAGEIAELVEEARRAGRCVDLRGNGSLLGGSDTPADAVPIPAGRMRDVVAYEPADLVIRVGAGMTIADLDAELAPHGQECPLDTVVHGPSTVGGRVASGLAGMRAGGLGPIRDHVLGLTIVRGDARFAQVGGGTVKNVSGFDLPRLFCGSWGTLGAIVDVTLKLRPRPRWSGWFTTERDPAEWPVRPYAPTSILVTSKQTYVAMEGHPDDAAEQAAAIGLQPHEGPDLPRHARASFVTDAVTAARALGDDGWWVDALTGIVHLDLDVIDPNHAQEVSQRHGGSYLDLSDARPPTVDNRTGHADIRERLRDALDPERLLAPWRLAT